jgi:hypothetical protein
MAPEDVTAEEEPRERSYEADKSRVKLQVIKIVLILILKL